MKVLLCAVALSIAPSLFAQNRQIPEIELVESIPIETILDNTDIRNTRETWLEMIRHAQRSIDIEQFYITDEPDKSLRDVIVALCSAADRGVIIRIIADARMYKTYPETIDSLGRRRNIETRRIDFSNLGGGIQHSKYFIVDDVEIFVGSQNFDWRALEQIHELGLRLRNTEIASVYRDIFSFDWEASAEPLKTKQPRMVLTKRYSLPVRVLTKAGDTAIVAPTCSPIGFIPDSTLWDERALVALIDRAKNSLLLQFLAYSPFERRGEMYTIIDDAIRRAAFRGVKVKMIVADWAKGSSAMKALKELAALPNIEVAFTVIPEWSGGYIAYARVEHCKYIVADETAFWIGTSNCEKNYFYSSRNLGITGTSTSLGGILSKIFRKSWDSPYKESITPNGSYKPRVHGEKK